MKKILIVIMAIMIGTMAFGKTFGDWKTGKVNGNKSIETRMTENGENLFFRIEKTTQGGFKISITIPRTLGRDRDSEFIFFKTGLDKNNRVIIGKFKGEYKIGKNYETIINYIITIDISKYTSRMDIFEDIISILKKHNSVKIFALNNKTGYNVTSEFSLIGFNKAFEHLISE